uniref:Arrestin_N domain-containing protein n=1 Tax=Schistosoma mansoni TaxID=6183 RepID=A0A5K4FDJ9_SCHMA
MKGFNKLIPTFQTVNEEIYCSMNSTLIGGGIPGTCELILAGKRYYPFEFELPAACPCSFVGSRGSIEYRLRVYLLLSNGEQLCADKGLKVLRKTIINKMMVIPSTLACPPITRNYVSSFDQFISSGSNTVKFTNLSRTCSRLSNLCKKETENILDEYDNSEEKLIEKNSVLDSTFTNDYIPDHLSSLGQSGYSNTDLDDTTKLTKYSLSSCLNDSHQSNPYLNSMQSTEDESQYPNGENDQNNNSMQSLCKPHFNRTMKMKKTLYNSLSKTTLTVQRCSDNPYPLPSTWISQSYVSSHAIYPTTCLGAQTGYPISCRLTVSQRQLNPGSRLTACLSLLVEDPFALLLAPSLNGMSNDLNWCAKFNTNINSCKKDLWSPLARAFVSYYLEDCIRQKFGNNNLMVYGGQDMLNNHTEYF